ncbi:hypothetical protein WICPIJ_008819 [Wickerhamomyces pijperi]|uniref:FAD-binding FR-type domain-containing protein n=1 Tax=Wickerhamomyces pijperi TaxID=599730 RepID=A0A9P8PWY1_WICPI|nr:hypothetical protein WICPIJ_008819 [Wickerhamomyces pijperi]
MVTTRTTFQGLLSTLILSGFAAAEKPVSTTRYYKPEQFVFWACEGLLSTYSFDYTSDPDASPYYEVFFRYPPAMGSLMQCYATQFGAYSKNFNRSINSINHFSMEWGSVETLPETMYLAYENSTKFVIDGPAVAEVSNSTNSDDDAAAAAAIVYQYLPFTLPEADVNIQYDYWRDDFYNYDMATTFAGILYLYFVFVFLIIGFFNMLNKFGLQTKLNNGFINSIRKHITMPALFNGKRTADVKFFGPVTALIPSRLETIIVFWFFALNLILTSVNYHAYIEYTYATPAMQLAENLANRTGILSFGLIPLLFLFAGRNNILMWFTGLPYSTFMVFHKWVARFMWIHALIHSVGWTYYAVSLNYLTAYEADAYWKWGVVATVIGAIMLFQAWKVFRNLSYEVFMVLHVVFGVLFLVACWYHCVELGWLEWLYATWGLWIVDRLLRVARIIRVGGALTAQIESIGEGTFKVRVPINGSVRVSPGQFGFISFMTPLNFWQSHPFTIVPDASGSKESNIITMLIKTKKGLTRQISKSLEQSTSGSIEMKVCIDGPYGGENVSIVEHKDNIVLVAGGNGIPGPLSYAVELNKDTTSSKRVKLIWIVQSLQYLTWLQEELVGLINAGKVQVDIHVTRDADPLINHSTKESEGTNSSTEEKRSTVLDLISTSKTADNFNVFFNGRPDVKELIMAEIKENNDIYKKENLAFLTCGAPVMCDQIRQTIANNLNESKYRVDLLEELQTW